MTKTEFKTEAGKAGIPSELYGAVLAGRIHHKGYGYVTGGKVVGIEWHDEWQRRTEYSCMIGTHEVTSLGEAPYVVLMKNRTRYLVEAWKVKEYVDKRFREWLYGKVKEKEEL